MRGHLVWLFMVAVGCGDNFNANLPPEIAPATVTTPEDTPVMHTIVATDPEGEPVALRVSAPANGTVAVGANRVMYTPEENFNGADSMTVTATDGTFETTATLTITVTPVNDAPVGTADALTGSEDMMLGIPTATLLANDTDIDGDTLTVASVGNATNGTVAMAGTDVQFMPAANFTGNATFEYVVNDGTVGASVMVAIAVGIANDPPNAVNDTRTTDEDVAVTIVASTLVANDTDPESQALTLTAVANPTNGTVALAGTDVTFTPAANFAGTATFEYTVSDGTETDTGTVTVTVAPIADPPVANDDPRSTVEDASLDLTSASIVANDLDPDGSTLTVSAVANPVNGTVVLVGDIVTFTPASEFSGTASFEYTVTDGGLTDVGVVMIEVAVVNDPPVANNDLDTIAEDVALVTPAATLAANDSDVDTTTLTVTAVGGATSGTVALAADTVTFTPAANFAGTATFQYTVSDGNSTDTGQVTVTVTPVNDAPVAGDDNSGVAIDGSVDLPHVALLANDTDVDGPPLAITSLQNGTNGLAILNAATITFTPDPGFSGTASFEYVVSDGTASDVALVTLTVGSGAVCGDGTITLPETCDDADTTGGDGCSALCQIEIGYACAGEPSLCAPICGDGLEIAPEECDDQNMVNEDGCTNACKDGVVCTAAAFPGGDSFAVDPQTGHCYASFDDDHETFAQAEASCVAVGGYLTTITSATEDTVARSVQNPAQNPWIGASEDGNTGDAIFDWVTDDAFGFTHFAPGQPDDDAGLGGNGDCLHLVNAAGEWNDTNCSLTTFVVGRICELEPHPCGDSIAQLFNGEECDDSNTASGDGCSATCQLEEGCGDGNLDAGEECDDDNTVGGDACSATCQVLEGCGDGNLDAGEECDDDNTVGGDACSATCQLEEGCGDGNLDAGEECDDDNTVGGDACSATCQVLEGCGDGNLDTGEQCDDDNVASGDGCSATCQGELLTQFTFTGAAGDEVSFPADGAAPPPGLDALPAMSRGPGLNVSAAANAFSAITFQVLPMLDLMDYYTFTVTPTPGATMRLVLLELDERRSLAGIHNWSVRSSLDGFTADLATFDVPDDDLFRLNQRIHLPAAFSAVTVPVEFRIYGWDSEASGGSWRLDNVELYGVSQ